MAWAGVALWAVCALRVALATVYFQEEFLDGGDAPLPGGRSSAALCPRPDLPSAL